MIAAFFAVFPVLDITKGPKGESMERLVPEKRFASFRRSKSSSELVGKSFKLKVVLVKLTAKVRWDDRKDMRENGRIKDSREQYVLEGLL